MCAPAVIAAAVAAVATGVSVVGQIQQSKALEKAVNAQSEQRADEIRDKATAEMFDRTVESFQRVGEQRVAGAERGLNDASRTLQLTNDAILFDYNFDNSRTLLNTENAQKARVAETNSQLARASRPTALGAALQIGTAGLKGFSDAGGFDKKD